MQRQVRAVAERWYEQLLLAELSETPSHVAVIQDGNRRYARKNGDGPTAGHRAGAETTQDLLEWCDELDIEEVTLYTFSTENFDRPDEERETLFDLIDEKLREFADTEEVHENEICIRAIGETHRLPPRVREAIEYAEAKTATYNEYELNIALAYGGRAELLGAARTIGDHVDEGKLQPEEVDVDTVESALYDGPSRDVDLIVRSGGDERTSNFLPWQANGNEAAVFFSAPYWPEFRKIDFLRGIRTYDHRNKAWGQSRLARLGALVNGMASQLGEAIADRVPLTQTDHQDPDPAETDVEPVD